jgi:hypothetical protein
MAVGASVATGRPRCSAAPAPQSSTREPRRCANRRPCTRRRCDVSERGRECLAASLRACAPPLEGRSHPLKRTIHRPPPRPRPRSSPQAQAHVLWLPGRTLTAASASAQPAPPPPPLQRPPPPPRCASRLATRRGALADHAVTFPRRPRVVICGCGCAIHPALPSPPPPRQVHCVTLGGRPYTVDAAPDWFVGRPRVAAAPRNNAPCGLVLTPSGNLSELQPLMLVGVRCDVTCFAETALVNLVHTHLAVAVKHTLALTAALGAASGGAGAAGADERAKPGVAHLTVSHVPPPAGAS